MLKQMGQNLKKLVNMEKVMAVSCTCMAILCNFIVLLLRLKLSSHPKNIQKFKSFRKNF